MDDYYNKYPIYVLIEYVRNKINEFISNLKWEDIPSLDCFSEYKCSGVVMWMKWNNQVRHHVSVSFHQSHHTLRLPVLAVTQIQHEGLVNLREAKPVR